LFSPGTPISSINKTDRHDITEILLKVALSILALILENIVKTSDIHDLLPSFGERHSVQNYVIKIIKTTILSGSNHQSK
jgi:hypothetical protein